MSNQDPLTNGSYWGPMGESAAEIQLEKLFLASGYLTGLTFGICSLSFNLWVNVLKLPILRNAGDPISGLHAYTRTGTSNPLFVLPHGLYDIALLEQSHVHCIILHWRGARVHRQS
jgi:hypothetical protein